MNFYHSNIEDSDAFINVTGDIKEFLRKIFEMQHYEETNINMAKIIIKEDVSVKGKRNAASIVDAEFVDII